MIMAQNERMTQLRSRMLSADSGGGSFFFGAALTAFAGASSSFLMSVSSALAPVSEVIGACDDANIVDCSLLHCLLTDVNITWRKHHGA